MSLDTHTYSFKTHKYVKEIAGIQDRINKITFLKFYRGLRHSSSFQEKEHKSDSKVEDTVTVEALTGILVTTKIW